ncbi:hypothetical protein F5144DRAFT_539562 [Chaetomium tenue]|uniref:Uncharacterized protein n=1 Tax=Chaetomium tenue TaxID=1854479 RepID=A0ACB7P0P7_9PEZI|nr:hypothetical protein F5144DRAFT_539562 [Chaetomium globosum]
MAPIARMPIQPPADLFISRTPRPPSTPAGTPDPVDSTQRPHTAPHGSGPTEPEQQAGPGRERSDGQRTKAEPGGNHNHNHNSNSDFDSNYNSNEKAPQPPQPKPTTLHHIGFARAEGHRPRPEQTDALARAAREFYSQGLEHQRQRRLRRRLVLLLFGCCCFHGLAAGAAAGC